MVSITLEKVWMVSHKIVDFSIFRQISQVRTFNNFQFLNITEHVSKNVPNQAIFYQDFITMVSFTQEGIWIVSDKIFHFQFFIKFHMSGPASF